MIPEPDLATRTQALWEKLNSLVEYQPDTGLIVWKKINHLTRKDVGDDASFPFRAHTGQVYRKVALLKIHYQVHRLALFLQTKVMPTHTVVHLNGNTCDNRWENLEECEPYRKGEDPLAFLKSAYAYDSIAGTFTRTRSINGKAIRGQRGDSAGEYGVRILCITSGKRWYAHTAAFYLMTGQLPTGYIRHKDKNRSNNKWENLVEMQERRGQREGEAGKEGKKGETQLPNFASAFPVAKAETSEDKSQAPAIRPMLSISALLQSK